MDVYQGKNRRKVSVIFLTSAAPQQLPVHRLNWKMLTDISSRDFTQIPWDMFPVEYTSERQKIPDLSLRSINRLLISHETPMPHGIYEFIRAREIFDRVESYKTLLEDIRLFVLKKSSNMYFIDQF